LSGNVYFITLTIFFFIQNDIILIFYKQKDLVDLG
jgi:hypothetical protein